MSGDLGRNRRKRKDRNIDVYKERLTYYELAPDVAMKMNNWSKEQLESEITLLKQKIEMSKRGKGSRVKGASYERDIAKIFEEKWGVKLVRTPSSGGFQKKVENELIRGDLSCIDPNISFGLHIECKKQKTWKLKDWFFQALSDCPKNNIPTVIFHLFQENREGKRVTEAEDFVMVRLSDFLEIVDEKKLIKRIGELQDDKPKRDNISKSKPRKRIRP